MPKQITQLPVAASVAASDVFPLDQSGTTKQATLTAIAAGLPSGTGTGGLVRQTNPSFIGGVRITDAVYPFTQWTNTGAPADKNRVRGYVETNGTTGLARLNDAENVGTSLISWDVNDNCGVGTFSPQAKHHVVAPALSAILDSRQQMARWQGNNGDESSVRLYQARFAEGQGWQTASTLLQNFTNESAQAFLAFNYPGNTGGISLGVNSTQLVPEVSITSNSKIGIGTSAPTQKLSVNGNIDCVTTFAQFVAVINSYPQVTCTTSAGYGWRFHNTSNGASLGYCIIQGTTDNFVSSFIDGFQVNTNGSCVIGPGSAAVQNVYTAVVTHTPATISANGGVQFLDVTLTGLTGACNLFVNSFSLSNNSILVRAEFQANNTARIYWVNPTASPVTLSSAVYRVSGIVFA